jgi:AraC-like DNA-binding protein/NADH:ubiquinone oxidoreductase subunit K
MAHQINIFFLLFGALQGWLLSVWFFWNRRKESSYLYISLSLFVVGLQLTSKVISKGWLMENTGFFYSLSYKLPYLIGPLVYLFAKARAGKKFNQIDLIHLLPFVAFSTAEYISTALKIYRYLHVYAAALFQLGSLIVYSYYAIKVSDKSLKSFVLTIAFAESIICVTLALMVFHYPNFPDVRILFLTLTLVIYWISYKAVAREEPFAEKTSSVMLLSTQKTTKYAHSSLKSEEADRIQQALHASMLNQRLYLDSDLTIDTLAAKLGTTRHHLSQVLNERMQKTYAEYLVELRLEEAKRRLTDKANDVYTISAIALDSGFNSVSAFNEAFKKRFQTTPSKFRDHRISKMSA